MGLIPNLSQTEWEIDCTDTFDRPRTIRIRTDGGRVIVGFPPGEAAKFDVAQFARFRSAILDAGYQASRQAGHG